jgi:hypothetical protein
LQAARRRPKPPRDGVGVRQRQEIAVLSPTGNNNLLGLTCPDGHRTIIPAKGNICRHGGDKPGLCHYSSLDVLLPVTPVIYLRSVTVILTLSRKWPIGVWIVAGVILILARDI